MSGCINSPQRIQGLQSGNSNLQEKLCGAVDFHLRTREHFPCRDEGPPGPGRVPQLMAPRNQVGPDLSLTLRSRQGELWGGRGEDPRQLSSWLGPEVPAVQHGQEQWQEPRGGHQRPGQKGQTGEVSPCTSALLFHTLPLGPPQDTCVTRGSVSLDLSVVTRKDGNDVPISRHMHLEAEIVVARNSAHKP